MKIVHICHTYVDNHTYQENELSKAHVKLGNAVTMISTQDYAGAINFKIETEPIKSIIPYFIDGVKIIRLPLKYKVDYRISQLKGLYESIEAENPDILYFHGGATFNLLSIVKYKKKHPNCFLCIDFHAEYYNSGTNIFSKLFHKTLLRTIIKSAIKFVDIAYYITPLVGKFTEEMYKIPRNKMKMLQMGGDFSLINFEEKESIRNKLRNKHNIADGDIVIITGGRIESEKNTTNLVNAFNSIENNKMHLIIFGNIVDEYKAELLNTIADQKRIHLIGYIDPKEICNYFLASDIACFPGGQSVLWQLAICCGLPLVIKYFFGLEYLDLGGNVKFLYHQDHATIKKVLLELIDTPDLINSMAKIAFQKGREYFSYENISKIVINDSQVILREHNI